MVSRMPGHTIGATWHVWSVSLSLLESFISNLAQTEPETTRQGFHAPSLHHIAWLPPLYVLSRIMGSFDFSEVKPSPNASIHGESEALWANDGLVPMFSQWHPFDCSYVFSGLISEDGNLTSINSETSCQHWHPSYTLPQLSRQAQSTDLVPGVWNVYDVADATHVSLVPFWLGTPRQQAFWEATGRWLRAIDNCT